MKQLNYRCADNNEITLDVPSCIKDCPFHHREKETALCCEDKDNVKTMVLKDITDAKRFDYPTWCPLTEKPKETSNEKSSAKDSECVAT